MLDQITELHVIAGVIALAMVLIRFRAPKWVFGPDARFWNPLRRFIVPLLDRLVSRHGDEYGLPDEIDYASYELANSEYAGRVYTDVHTFGEALHDDGYTRQVLAALKTLDDGRIERASWAKRDGYFANRQTHVMLFDSPTDETGIDVFAHTEPNAINPLTAWKHYRGEEYRPHEGVDEVREFFGNSAFEWSES